MARKMKDSGVEWIGKIPDGWSLIKIKQIADPSVENSFMDGDWIESPYIVNQGIRYYTTGNVGDGDFKVQGSGFITEETFDKLNCKLAYPGDLVFSRLNAPYGRSCILPSESERYVVAVDIVILRPRRNFDKRYICYITQCNGYQDRVFDMARGTAMKRISRSNLGMIQVPVPNDREQCRIADYLDAKCASIDDVIAKTNESIEEYKKLKQAVITEAVTKGVRGKRPMKDSGIDWIGQVPCDWNLQRIKTLFDLRTELNFKPLEEVNLISLYTDKGVVQHVDLEKTTGNKAMNADGYKVVYENDIVVNIILCWMGAIGRSAYNGVTSPAYDVYCPKNGVESRFYHYYFRTAGFNGECFTRGRGIMLMRWRTYSDQFRDIRVVVPPLSEQKEIVKFLDSKCAAIDTLISKKQQFIDELTAYKKSLIYEYVTGKKEVPA